MVKCTFTIVGLVIGAAALFANPAWSVPQDVRSTVSAPFIAYSSVLTVNPAASSQQMSERTHPIRTESGATLPIPVSAVLDSGVLVVISKASQEMHVFRDGKLWDTSPVSTGKKGKETPSGVFPILQKRRHHRSNLYSNAPMPYMQRMTWDGIAIHQGKLPGYPASHGCIRLPRDFAGALFRLTSRNTTTVVVTDHALGSSAHARIVAEHMPMPRSGQRGHLIQGAEPQLAQLELETPTTPPGPITADPAQRQRLASQPTAPQPRRSRQSGASQTIQLAAAKSLAEADAHWLRVSRRFPELSQYKKQIIPATVNAQKYYRLRAHGPGAKAACASIRRSGMDCFSVG